MAVDMSNEVCRMGPNALKRPDVCNSHLLQDMIAKRSSRPTWRIGHEGYIAWNRFTGGTRPPCIVRLPG